MDLKISIHTNSAIAQFMRWSPSSKHLHTKVVFGDAIRAGCHQRLTWNGWFMRGEAASLSRSIAR